MCPAARAYAAPPAAAAYAVAYDSSPGLSTHARTRRERSRQPGPALSRAPHRLRPSAQTVHFSRPLISHTSGSAVKQVGQHPSDQAGGWHGSVAQAVMMMWPPYAHSMP
ncbi:hypothetical protein [Streptomyces yaizuensis]|uniref:Uncharacterized protein n=1 Tax=Streptomyces yaizuensis TaxID=2989713 RepID=A0ABQ5P6C9_9ACTN|nr:hypothetical protein [Streptomyces sp. YSPA8]GLF98033.1 hypothetical protein SYYSPA8_27070 [Streptomyces sp. YSPA8]